MTRSELQKKLWTLPNAFALSRLFAAPVCLVLAWFGHERGFLLLSPVALLSNIVDGSWPGGWGRPTSSAHGWKVGRTPRPTSLVSGRC